MNGLAQNPVVFFPLAFYILSMGALVLLSSGPMQAVFALVLSMSGLALMFMALGAYFLGAVQLVVYLGAVVVLFLIAIKFFDMSKEKEISFVEGSVLGKFLTVGTLGIFLGAILGSLSLKTYRSSLEGGHANGESIGFFSNFFAGSGFLLIVTAVLLVVVTMAMISINRVGGGSDDGN